MTRNIKTLNPEDYLTLFQYYCLMRNLGCYQCVNVYVYIYIFVSISVFDLVSCLALVFATFLLKHKCCKFCMTVNPAWAFIQPGLWVGLVLYRLAVHFTSDSSVFHSIREIIVYKGGVNVSLTPCISRDQAQTHAKPDSE